ncbi:MAG: 3-keto-disaccharide hydrolase, partial [Prosthecobacter sp.]
MRLPLLATAALFSLSSLLNAADNPFVGRWALTIPGGGAGWLGVEEKDGALSSSVLWGGGSVVPTTTTNIDGTTLVITREQKNKQGKVTVETIVAKTVGEGDILSATTSKKNEAGKEVSAPAEFTGKRIPAIPAKPDLSKVKFGEPIQLLNGKDLTGWRLLKEGVDNGWSVVDGMLQNRVVKAKDKHFGNLRTDAEFEDFNLKTEVRTQENSNSGIYLRGIYEVQIMESFGKPLDSHHMGALYSRITPSVNAEKPIGEWQTLDITLVDRH